MEKSKWEPPFKDLRSLSLLSMISDEDEGGSAAADNKPSVSPLKARSGDILVAHPPPAQEPVQEGLGDRRWVCHILGEKVRPIPKKRRGRVGQQSPALA